MDSAVWKFPEISRSDKRLLHKYVSAEEVKRGVFDMGALKMPGRDGISQPFSKNFGPQLGNQLSTLSNKPSI